MNHKNSLTGSLSDSFRTFRRTGATFIPLVLFETLFMILVALAVGLAQIFIMESISRIL